MLDSKGPRRSVVAFLVASASTLAIVKGAGLLGVSYLGLALVAGAVTLGMWARERERPTLRSFWLGCLTACLAVGLRWTVQDFTTCLRSPQEWDVLCWYLYGRTAAAGLSVYRAADLTAALAQIDLPFALSADFRALVTVIIFRYPPATLLLFRPLGELSFETANLLSRAVLLGATLTCAGIVPYAFRMWPRGPRGLLAAAALLLSLPGHYSNLEFAQTNSLVLLGVLLFAAASIHTTRALALALAVIVKPIAAVLAIDILRRRALRELLLLALVLAAATAVAVVALGSGLVTDYLETELIGTIPAAHFAFAVNHSLLAALLRAGLIPVEGGSPVLHPTFLALSFLLTLCTLLATARMKDRSLTLGTWICLGLVLYPNTLVHYGVLLFYPICAAVVAMRAKGLRLPMTATFVAAVVFAAGRSVLAASTACYVVLLVCGCGTIGQMSNGVKWVSNGSSNGVGPRQPLNQKGKKERNTGEKTA